MEGNSSERTYIAELFRKNFVDFIDSKIVIYGLAYSTEIIISECGEFNIIGLMDGFQKSGKMYGKDIFSDQEVIENGTDIIVIAARANSTKIITKRIEQFCKDNSIKLFDIRGNDCLVENTIDLDEVSYFKADYQDLISEINRHDVISFDVFDTLLIRQVLYPDDVFENLENITGVKGFAKERIQAEREANRRYGAPRFEQIYGIVGENKKLSIEDAEKCRLEELRYERKCLIPRNDMVKALKYAVEAQKDVYLVTNMYLPSEFLTSVLRDSDINGYKKLIVSCEYGKDKTNGLFDVLSCKAGNKTCIHIGDDMETDIETAKKYGFDTFRVLSPIDMLDISLYGKVLNAYKNLAEKNLAGVLISRFFNSPFAFYEYKGKVQIDSGYELGNSIMGAVLTGFIVWLFNQCMKDQIEVLLLAARDGYIINMLLDAYESFFPDKKFFQYIYFYTSRSAAVSATIFNDRDLEYAASISFSGKPERLMKERFLLDENDIEPCKKEENLSSYVRRHDEKIYEKSKKLRDNYRKYIDRLDILNCERLATVDHVSSGTCQMCLEELLGKRIKGYYFVHYSDEYEKKQRLDTKAFFENGFLSGLKSYYSGNYLPMESVIVSDEPTLKCFDENGKVLFMEEKRSAAEIEYIKNVQSGILDFWKSFLFCNGSEFTDLSSEYVDSVYELIRKKYTVVNNCILTEKMTQNEYCGTKYVMDWMFD